MRLKLSLSDGWCGFRRNPRNPWNPGAQGKGTIHNWLMAAGGDQLFMRLHLLAY